MLEVLLLLLPVAAASGWYAASKHYQESSEKKHEDIPKDYFRGLNYLIDNEIDQAVDVFIKLLEVNSDTVEMHQALGNLFRRKGEISRAIRIHQNLIARPQLSKEQRELALLELALDYLGAGVLNQAEKLALQLIEINPEENKALEILLAIYQKQKDWKQAITIAKKLENNKRDKHLEIAHYYCELAQEKKNSGNFSASKELLLLALEHDPQSIRAYFELANLGMENKDYQNAITNFLFVNQNAPELICEILTPLATCYQQIKKQDEFIKILEQSIEKNPHPNALAFLGNHLKESKDTIAAKRLLDKLSQAQALYRCRECGFSGKHLYWQCPSCKKWSTVKPELC
jgi:lipopolysaccharide assembly protein B